MSAFLASTVGQNTEDLPKVVVSLFQASESELRPNQKLIDEHPEPPAAIALLKDTWMGVAVQPKTGEESPEVPRSDS